MTLILEAYLVYPGIEIGTSSVKAVLVDGAIRQTCHYA
jgi:sugar (pentulose or hexulose) kinase